MDFWHDWSKIPLSHLVVHDLPRQIVPNALARPWHDSPKIYQLSSLIFIIPLSTLYSFGKFFKEMVERIRAQSFDNAANGHINRFGVLVAQHRRYCLR